MWTIIFHLVIDKSTTRQRPITVSYYNHRVYIWIWNLVHVSCESFSYIQFHVSVYSLEKLFCIHGLNTWWLIPWSPEVSELNRKLKMSIVNLFWFNFKDFFFKFKLFVNFLIFLFFSSGGSSVYLGALFLMSLRFLLHWKIQTKIRILWLSTNSFLICLPIVSL